jgi:CRP-like cAMP-binding protein
MLEPNKRNAFLAGLSTAEYDATRRYLAPLKLRVGECLHYLAGSVEDVVFPHSGLVTLNMPLRDNPGAAAALIGRDGIVGALAALARTPAASNAVVHIGGQASRLSAPSFRNLLDQNPSLHRHVARYTLASIAQVQQNVACNAVHPLEARICRWLLAIQAQCPGEKVALTQSTLAQMLGVRRTTVTQGVGRLEILGAIKCHRGYIQIIHPDDLERRSCECHRILNACVSKLLASFS